MHFFYTDESGDTGTNLKDQNQPILVMGGVNLRDVGWNETHARLNDILVNYFYGSLPEDFELHAYDLLSLYGNGPFEGHDIDKRVELASNLLDVIIERKHGIHFIAVDKKTIATEKCEISLTYNLSVAYLLCFDYLVTYINWYTKEKLGNTSRALIVLDDKEQHRNELIKILHDRRYKGASAHKVKWIVDVTYSVDSNRNPMIQVSDLVIFCVRRFLEIDHGYRNSWPNAAKEFYAQCYKKIEGRLAKKGIVERGGKNMNIINNYLNVVHCKPNSNWKNKYGLNN